jgi:extracellular elastinolytic metalloproteinase
VPWKTVTTGGFGYQAPRPTAPDLHDQSFALTTPTHAACVRFLIDSVQGETLTYAQAAELQVFGDAVGASPTAPPAGPDFTDAGTTVPATPPLATRPMRPTCSATDFTTNCATMPPASQGAEAWITKLPAGFGDGTHTVSVVGGESTRPLAVDHVW